MKMFYSHWIHLACFFFMFEFWILTIELHVFWIHRFGDICLQVEGKRKKSMKKEKEKINYYCLAECCAFTLNKWTQIRWKIFGFMCLFISYCVVVQRCKWMFFFSLLIRIIWTDFIGFDMLFIICITWIKLKLILMDAILWYVWCMDIILCIFKQTFDYIFLSAEIQAHSSIAFVYERSD